MLHPSSQTLGTRQFEIFVADETITYHSSPVMKVHPACFPPLFFPCGGGGGGPRGPPSPPGRKAEEGRGGGWAACNPPSLPLLPPLPCVTQGVEGVGERKERGKGERRNHTPTTPSRHPRPPGGARWRGWGRGDKTTWNLGPHVDPWQKDEL